MHHMLFPITTPSICRGILAGALLAFATVSHAATVTWGAATNITGDSDVSTTGTLVGAVHLGDASVTATTVNGVTFVGATATGGPVTSGNFALSTVTAIVVPTAAAPFSSLSAPYQALLGLGAGDFGTPVTLTMSALVTGQTYQFQWWSNVSGNATNFVTTATAGGAVSLSSNTGGATGGLGQYAIGTFVADATTQVITFSRTTVAEDIAGFQLRQIASASAVPEPGSALVGMMTLGVCFSGLVKRSRQAK